MKKFALLAAVALAISTPATAAVQIQEEDFGPKYGNMVGDAIIGKPLQTVNALLGTAAYAISLPFTTISGDTHRARQKLVVEPWDALKRCLGCSPTYDQYERTISYQDEYERTTVTTRPALIDHDDRVTVGQ